MGEVIGAGIVAHVPTIVMPEAERRELNAGQEISLVPGLRRLRRDVFDRLRPDTVVVFDTHWFTTFEFVVASHASRTGLYTSDELPRGMCQMPYDFPGDPDLARLIAEEGDRAGTWITPIDDPYLPIHYPTVNLLPFLQGDARWVSVSTPQTGETDDFLLAGSAIGAAVARSDRRVVLLASGAMSHKFWPLKALREHEPSDPVHIRTDAHRAADMERLDWMRAGRHDRIIDSMDDFMRFTPEGRFGHYLQMVGAIGGRDCRATGEMFSDYESAVGTGQAHVWFERPPDGWSA
jgi:3,4-dihydroxyphenylacetate 2,3-dioxygenase